MICSSTADTSTLAGPAQYERQRLQAQKAHVPNALQAAMTCMRAQSCCQEAWQGYTGKLARVYHAVGLNTMILACSSLPWYTCRPHDQVTLHALLDYWRQGLWPQLAKLAP